MPKEGYEIKIGFASMSFVNFAFRSFDASMMLIRVLLSFLSFQLLRTLICCLLGSVCGGVSYSLFVRFPHRFDPTLFRRFTNIFLYSICKFECNIIKLPAGFIIYIFNVYIFVVLINTCFVPIGTSRPPWDSWDSLG